MAIVEYDKLVLNNFKSYRGEHEFQLARSPGLYFIEGENKANPSLGSNGSGKSTLLAALHYVLIGKTDRGLKAANLRPWDQKGSAAVTLHVAVDGEGHTIHRSWNPNKLLIDDETAEQEDVEYLIGLSETEIQHTVAVGQTATLFFDLRPADKLKLFSDALDLDIWLELSEHAKEEADNIADSVDSLVTKESRLEAKIEEHKAQAKEYLDKAEEFEDDRQKRVEAKEAKIENAEKDKATLNDQEKEARNEIDKADKEASKYEEQLPDIEEEISSLRKQHEGLSKSQGVLEYKRKEGYERLNKFEEELKEGSPCPTCEQKISKAHIDREKKTIKKQLEEIENELEALVKDIDKIESSISDLVDKKNSLKKKADEAKSKSRKADRELLQIKNDKDCLDNDIKQDEEAIVKMSKEDNPYDDMAKGIIEKRDQAKSDLQKKQKDRKKQEKLQASYEYWIQGFKDIRLAVVENALNELEIETNNHLVQLGLSDWSIKYDIERETKSGSISKGFNVFVYSPDNEEAVPWEAWSGGETQRLRMAGAFGLSSLIQDRKGVQTNVEIIDEKTEGLGGSGVHDQIERLHERAESLDKAIYLIDHRSHDYGWFSGVISVVKTEDGSHITEGDRDERQ